jgi:RNA recognition motif-containing protein
LFGEYGSVVSADLVKDHFTGRSKGFSFVDSLKNKIAENVIGPCDLPACP